MELVRSEEEFDRWAKRFMVDVNSKPASYPVFVDDYVIDWIAEETDYVTYTAHDLEEMIKEMNTDEHD